MEEDATVNWLKEIRKGYIRLIVLALLSKKPHHGYEIMKEVREKTSGSVRLLVVEYTAYFKIWKSQSTYKVNGTLKSEENGKYTESLIQA
jgi:hypothetical protein